MKDFIADDARIMTFENIEKLKVQQITEVNNLIVHTAMLGGFDVRFINTLYDDTRHSLIMRGFILVDKDKFTLISWEP